MKVALLISLAYRPELIVLDEPQEEVRLAGVYERLRLKLLDLSKKNRMLNYSLGDWGFGVQDSWVSGFSQVAGPITATTSNWVNPHVNSWNQIDLNISRVWATSSAIWVSLRFRVARIAPMPWTMRSTSCGSARLFPNNCRHLPKSKSRPSATKRHCAA